MKRPGQWIDLQIPRRWIINLYHVIIPHLLYDVSSHLSFLFVIMYTVSDQLFASTCLASLGVWILGEDLVSRSFIWSVSIRLTYHISYSSKPSLAFYVNNMLIHASCCQQRDLTPPYVDDGFFEVVGFRDAWHGLVLFTPNGHGTRLAQVSQNLQLQFSQDEICNQLYIQWKVYIHSS